MGTLLSFYLNRWQIDVDKITFEFLGVKHFIGRESGPIFGILDLANIVTGPRRRYLDDITINFKAFHKCVEEEDADMQPESPSSRARTDVLSACFAQLIKVLATWREEEVKPGLIYLKINICFEKMSYQNLLERMGFGTDLSDLPAVSVINRLEICHYTRRMEIPANYVPALCGRLTGLRAVWAELGPGSRKKTTYSPYLEGKFSLLNK